MIVIIGLGLWIDIILNDMTEDLVQDVSRQ